MKNKRAMKDIISTKYIVWALLIYAVVVVLGTGFYHGVFFKEFSITNGWITQPDDVEFVADGFWLSFVASAFQDVLFFSVIGVLLFLHGKREPKNEDIKTKVNYFFPDVEEGELMSYLRAIMNKNSCIALNTDRTLCLMSENNGLLEMTHSTHSTITNLHHNYDLDENTGQFYLTPDEFEYPNDCWAIIHNFHTYTESEGRTVIASSERLTGENYNSPYNIKLKAGEKGQIHSNLTLWSDITQPNNFRPVMFTNNYNCFIENKIKDKSIEVEYILPKDGGTKKITIKPSESLDAINIKNFLPNTDAFVVKFRVLEIDDLSVKQ